MTLAFPLTSDDILYGDGGLIARLTRTGGHAGFPVYSVDVDGNIDQLAAYSVLCADMLRDLGIFEPTFTLYLSTDSEFVRSCDAWFACEVIKSLGTRAPNFYLRPHAGPKKLDGLSLKSLMSGAAAVFGFKVLLASVFGSRDSGLVYLGAKFDKKVLDSYELPSWFCGPLTRHVLKRLKPGCSFQGSLRFHKSKPKRRAIQIMVEGQNLITARRGKVFQGPQAAVRLINHLGGKAWVTPS